MLLNGEGESKYMIDKDAKSMYFRKFLIFLSAFVYAFTLLAGYPGAPMSLLAMNMARLQRLTETKG